MTNEDPTNGRRLRRSAPVVAVRLVSGTLGATVAAVATVATLATVLRAAPAGAGTLGLPDSATTQGDDVSQLWLIFVVLALLVTLLIWALTTYVVVSSIRRRRAGRVDTTVHRTEVETGDADVDAGTASAAGRTHSRPPPRQHQYNTRLEIVYTAIPLALVFVLLGLALRTTSTLTATGAEPALDVDVTGFQWQWQFGYPQQHITVSAGDQDAYPELVLPVGRTVRFHLRANDVIHSFWVPEFLEKRDLIPGVDNTIEVVVKAPGSWTGRCAEYCGFNHWRMKFSVRAVAADEFDRWVTDNAAKPQPIVIAAPR